VAHATKPDGTTTTTTVANHTYKDSKGKVTETTTSIFTQQVNPDGSTVNTYSLTVTDKDGNTTTTVTTSTTDTEGKVTNKTTCTGANFPTRDSGEIDSAPVFAPGSTINATPELTRRIEALAGSHTNHGDTGVEIGPDDEPEPVQYSPLNPGVIIVDTSNDAVWWTPELTMPDPDKVAGNITIVRSFEPITSLCLPTQNLPCPT
jgi:hypothetical protein